MDLTVIFIIFLNEHRGLFCLYLFAPSVFTGFLLEPSWLGVGSHRVLWCPAGKGVNVEGAVPSEQEVNQPKPAKRARTSFTADQLQVSSGGVHCSPVSGPWNKLLFRAAGHWSPAGMTGVGL